MKKIFLIIILLFQLNFVLGQKDGEGKTEWSQWKLASPCFPNLYISYKSCGWTSSVNKYCYNFRMKNTSSKNMHYNLDIKFVSGEDYSADGRFTLNAGKEFTHVSMYYDTKPIPNSNNFFTSTITKYIENQKDDWSIPSYTCNGSVAVCDQNCNISTTTTNSSNNQNKDPNFDKNNASFQDLYKRGMAAMNTKRYSEAEKLLNDVYYSPMIGQKNSQFKI